MSSDGKKWEKVASATLKNNENAQVINFGKTITSTHVRLITRSSHGAQGVFASIAEFTIVE